MSTYYITEPKAIPFETIKSAIMKNDDMAIITNRSGNPTITSPDYRNFGEGRWNWLHLEIDEETQTMTCCFRNGASDASDIIEYLEFSLGCRIISEYEPEYWGVNDWLDIGNDESSESVSSGELAIGS